MAIEPLDVAISFAAPELGIQAIRATAQLQNDGLWQADNIALPLNEEWQLDPEIRLSCFDLIRLNDTFTLP